MFSVFLTGVALRLERETVRYNIDLLYFGILVPGRAYTLSGVRKLELKNTHNRR